MSDSLVEWNQRHWSSWVDENVSTDSDSMLISSPSTEPLTLMTSINFSAHTHTHTHAPLDQLWICKLTSAPVSSLLSRHVSNMLMQPTHFLHFTSFHPPPTSIPQHPEPANDKQTRQRRDGEREGLQIKADNDVVMDGCSTHKQACEQQQQADHRTMVKSPGERGGALCSLSHCHRHKLAATHTPSPRSHIWHTGVAAHTHTHTVQRAACIEACTCSRVIHNRMWTERWDGRQPIPGHCSQSKTWHELWFIKDEMGDTFIPELPCRPCSQRFCFYRVLSEYMNVKTLAGALHFTGCIRGNSGLEEDEQCSETHVWEGDWFFITWNVRNVQPLKDFTGLSIKVFSKRKILLWMTHTVNSVTVYFVRIIQLLYYSVVFKAFWQFLCLKCWNIIKPLRPI